LTELQETLAEHKALAKKRQDLLKYYSELNHDHEDVLAACFDLQQTLPIPKLTANLAYYKRKM